MASTTEVIISDGGFGCPPGAISSSVWASCVQCFLDFALTFIGNKRSLQEVISPLSFSDLSHELQRFSALRFPIPDNNFTIRLNATSSRGLATKRMNETTSLMWACSKNRIPL